MLAPELVTALAQVLNGLGVPAVLLLRSPTAAPRPATGLRELRESVGERLLPDTLVVGDTQAWSLRHDRLVPEPRRAG